MRYVVDASVAIKWFCQSAPDEDHLDRAIDLLYASRDLAMQFYQPPHFIAEVAAVLARKKPETAEADLLDLLALDLRIVEDSAIYQCARSIDPAGSSPVRHPVSRRRPAHAQRDPHHGRSALFRQGATHRPDRAAG